MDKWDVRFLAIAHSVADWSKDPVEGVGAVLISPDKHQVAWGFNGFPTGVQDSTDRLHDKEMKRSLSVHAELNAILNCNVRPVGWTLYCTKPPCLDCAKAIIQAGVARVVAPCIHPDSSWADTCIKASALFREAGVETEYVPNV